MEPQDMKTKKDRIAKLRADVTALDAEARRIAAEIASIKAELSAEGIDPGTTDEELSQTGFEQAKKVVGFRLLNTTGAEIEAAKASTGNAALAVTALIPFD